jgi:hypothetical protein
MRSAMAWASTRESLPPPNPAVHISTPPPTAASYLTVARTNINVTPHQSGTPAPAINAPSPSAFAHPNYYKPINDNNPGKPPHGGDFPTSNKNSPSLLMPPSPRDGSDNNPPPSWGVYLTSDDCHLREYFALCDWVKRDLIHLKRIDTSINISNHLTKSLPRILFHRHADYLLGHIPRNTCRYINMQSQHMATQMRIMIGMFLIHLQPLPEAL